MFHRSVDYIFMKKKKKNANKNASLMQSENMATLLSIILRKTPRHYPMISKIGFQIITTGYSVINKRMSPKGKL